MKCLGNINISQQAYENLTAECDKRMADERLTTMQVGRYHHEMDKLWSISVYI